MENTNEFDWEHMKNAIEAKIKRKITKKELAEIAEISQSSLTYWSEFPQNTFKFLVNVSNHFKIPVDRLLKK